MKRHAMLLRAVTEPFFWLGFVLSVISRALPPPDDGPYIMRGVWGVAALLCAFCAGERATTREP